MQWSVGILCFLLFSFASDLKSHHRIWLLRLYLYVDFRSSVNHLEFCSSLGFCSRLPKPALSLWVLCLTPRFSKYFITPNGSHFLPKNLKPNFLLLIIHFFFLHFPLFLFSQETSPFLFAPGKVLTQWFSQTSILFPSPFFPLFSSQTGPLPLFFVLPKGSTPLKIRRSKIHNPYPKVRSHTLHPAGRQEHLYSLSNISWF